jgi:hypothetical protein
MRKILLWVAVALFGSLVLIVGISALNARSQANHEKTTASTFLNGILSDDSTATYNMFGTNAKNSQTPDDWSSQVDKISGFFKDKHPSFQSISASGTKTAVTYTIEGTDGDYVMTVNLVGSKDKLKVDSFTSLLSAH